MEWYKTESHPPAPEATILQSKNRGGIILIPRIKLVPSDINLHTICPGKESNALVTGLLHDNQ